MVEAGDAEIEMDEFDESLLDDEVDEQRIKFRFSSGKSSCLNSFELVRSSFVLPIFCKSLFRGAKKCGRPLADS